MPNKPKAKLNRAGRIAANVTKAGLTAAMPGGLAFKAGKAIVKSFKKKPKPPKKQTQRKPSKPKSIKRNIGPSPTRRIKR
jgi:hypothetical protein